MKQNLLKYETDIGKFEMGLHSNKFTASMQDNLSAYFLHHSIKETRLWLSKFHHMVCAN